MKNKNKESLKELDKIASSMSQLFSSVCRNIIMALCAIAWLGIFGTGENPITNSDKRLIAVILLVILYFTFELLQYYLSCKVAKNNKCKLRNNEITEKGLIISMRKLSSFTYRIIDIKIILLTIIVILLGFYFGEKL